jgi:hypothetical protein
MKIQMLCAAIAVLALAGCNKAEEPAKVSRDVAEASQEGQQKIDQARQDAAQVQNKLDEKSVENAGDVTLVKADAEHKIAVQKCEALGGEMQKACKATADAALETAKAHVQTATAAVAAK